MAVSPGLQHSILLITWQLCLTCLYLKGTLLKGSGGPQPAAKSGLSQQINSRPPPPTRVFMKKPSLIRVITGRLADIWLCQGGGRDSAELMS